MQADWTFQELTGFEVEQTFQLGPIEGMKHLAEIYGGFCLQFFEELDHREIPEVVVVENQAAIWKDQQKLISCKTWREVPRGELDPPYAYDWAEGMLIWLENVHSWLGEFFDFGEELIFAADYGLYRLEDLPYLCEDRGITMTEADRQMMREDGGFPLPPPEPS